MIALSQRQKLAGLGLALAGLVLATAISSGSATMAARITLGAGSIAGLAWWVWRQRALPLGRFAKTPRLQVVQRVGLSARSGVALIEVDGRSFLIVHGEGGTRIRRVSSRAAVMAQALKEDRS